jgi:hypothetical protein
MKKLFLAMCVALCVSCTPAASPPPALQVASAVVQTAADAWVAAAEACVAVATAKQDDAFRQSCEKVLEPARLSILAAANAVDAATASSLPCSLSNVASALGQVSEALAAAGVTVPPIVADAISLAQGFAGPCPADAGASQ